MGGGSRGPRGRWVLGSSFSSSGSLGAGGVLEGRAEDSDGRRRELAQRAAKKRARPVRFASKLLQPTQPPHPPRERGHCRENTEGKYAGLEHEVVPGVVESLKFCSEQIAKYAFEYAYLNNRKKVTAVHKANIMKLADGLFLESCREVATKYPSINYNEIIVDNCCMQIIS
ncbi:NAD-dependent isocitrate dehydrogenase [Pyrus ussuriensis x Pyrus communis]|uniref:NAD-dependent isocitrate dehydrogenase n=1 Tax=Pyrus ussuriensis x Pyrus communis TaxID=2448454 RepID=A0A5N5GM12_9ROSA|nr:NAD-dependent isocitrate dehydrogenase [Pyrus ussuriensis x Pyrus communis]